MLRELKINFSEGKIDKFDYGHRSKLGGIPDWLQNDETPKCPHCRHTMEFIAQIDSIDYTGFPNPKAEYMLGDVGMIYVFFCKKCGTSTSVFQE